MVFCMGIFLETVAQRLLQSTGNTFLSMISLVAGALTNVILDPILIFGLLGAPALGIRGAAIATVIGQWIGAAVALLLNHFKNPEISFVFRKFRFEKKELLLIYKVGIPTILMQAIGSLMLSAVNAILMPVSATAVAFFGVYYKLQSFLLMPMNGLGQAAIPIVGYIFSAITVVLGYAASGLGNGIINMMGNAIRQLLVLVPLLFLFTKFFGIGAAWYAFWISEITAFFYCIFSMRREYRKKGGSLTSRNLKKLRPCKQKGRSFFLFVISSLAADPPAV